MNFRKGREERNLNVRERERVLVEFYFSKERVLGEFKRKKIKERDSFHIEKKILLGLV